MAIVGMLAARWYQLPASANMSPELQRYSKAYSEFPVIYSRGCNADIRSDKVNICTFGPPDATHTAVLIGDSTAAQWSPAAIKAFDKAGWRLLVMTKSGCPMVDGPYFYRNIGREFVECGVWRQHAIQQVVAAKPDIVVLSSYWWDNRSSSSDWWVDGTRSVLDALSPASGRVYVLRSTPHLPFKGPTCLSQRLMLGKLAPTLTCQAPYPEAQEDRIFSWLQSAAAGFSNVSPIDMNDRVCPQGTCYAQHDGMVVFRDDHHIAVRYAESLSPVLAQRLAIEAARPDGSDGSLQKQM
jgi:hypothetical protein